MLFGTRSSQHIMSALLQGHKVMAALRAKLEYFESKTRPLTPTQRIIQKHMSATLCEYVYGPSTVAKFSYEIMKQNDFNLIKTMIDITAYRRAGFTTAEIHFIAAAMLTVPDFKCVWFVSQQVDTDPLSNVRELLLMSDNVCSEANCISVNVGGNVRTLTQYPSSTYGLYGVDGNCVLIDGGSRVNDLEWREVVMSLLARTKTSLVIVSTHEDRRKWLLELRNAGVVPRLEILDPCADCRARECEHM